MSSFWPERVPRLSPRLLRTALTVFLVPFWLPLATSAEDGVRLSGGLRIVSVTPGSPQAPALPPRQRGGETPTLGNMPPLEGPQTYVIMTVTDERAADEFDWFASAHAGLEGSPLPNTTNGQVLAVFDSGGGSHLVSYPDAVGLGLQGAESFAFAELLLFLPVVWRLRSEA